MVALRLRVAFTPGTRSFVLQAFGATYFTRGAAANISSSTRTPIAYALPAARGHYAFAGPAIGLSYVQPGVSPSAPQKLWPGVVSSSRVAMAVWPPSDGTNPPAFNYYRTDMPLGPGVPLNATPRIPVKADGAANTIPFSAFTDLTVAPGTSYNYYATSTSSATAPYIESAPSPQMSVVTLAATGNTPPAAVTDPATYISAYSLPGGTVWTATQNGATANTGTNGAGTGAKFNVGCSAQYAFNNAGAGDLVVLTAGVKYTSSNGSIAFTVPATANGFYITTTQDPAYNAAGTLPPYSYVPNTYHARFAATSGPLAGATSLTLTMPFPGRTGWYKTSFDSTNACKIESKECLYTTGSTSVVWDIGLQANCGTRLLVGYGNQVTPWDAGIPIGPGLVTNPSPSMPILEYSSANGGQGLQILGDNIRMVGICVQPAANHTVSGTTVTSYFSSVIIAASASGVTIDRCVIGRNNLVSTRSYFWRSLQIGGPNSVAHQCYFFGADSGPHGADTQAVFFSGNGPAVVQNCYLEALFEGSISGGVYIALASMPHDLVIRYCWGHKPTCWQQVTTPDPTGATNPNPTISYRVKNHLELKCCFRAEWYGNNLQGNGFNFASAGQQGRAMPITARDQNSTNAPQTLVSLTANGAGVATAVAAFDLPMATGTFFYTTIQNAAVAAFNGTYERCQMVTTNTFTFPVPVGLSGGTGPATGKTLQYIRPPQCGGMWQSITDVNVHDNQIYGVAQTIYAASGVDGCPTVHVERIYFHNNLGLLNPTLTDNAATPGKCTLVGGDIGGPSANMRYDQNTIIACPAGSGNTVSTASSGIRSIQSGSPNTLQDRAVVTNNIIDATNGGFLTSTGSVTPPHNGASGGTMVQFSFDETNLVWDKNIFTLDTSSGANAYPGTTNNPVAYSALGTATLISNTTIPDSPSDWNIVSGPYATDSTVGGPRGSTFLHRSVLVDTANLFLGNSMQGLSLVTTSTSANFNLMQFQGTDTKYGNVLPRAPASLWGGNQAGANDQIQYLYNLVGDIAQAIVTDNTVPQGVSSQVRQCTLVNAYNGTFHTQASYIEFPNSAPQSMAYLSLWIWYQGDLNTSVRSNASNHFAEVAEFKVGNNLERFQIGWYITADPGNNWTGNGSNPTWVMFHDDGGSTVYVEDILGLTSVNAGTNGRQTYAAPMPVGQWFKVEWAFNRIDSASQGWMWMALTVPGSSDPILRAGVQVYAARGAFSNSSQTIGYNSTQPAQLINKVFVDNCAYTDIIRSSGSQFVIKTTDIQLYNHWPWTASMHPPNFQ